MGDRALLAELEQYDPCGFEDLIHDDFERGGSILLAYIDVLIARRESVPRPILAMAQRLRCGAYGPWQD